jgi:hypothetical protein
LPEGESHSNLALPGASLMPRKKGRKPPEGVSTLDGPALTLDALAIFR